MTTKEVAGKFGKKTNHLNSLIYGGYITPPEKIANRYEWSAVDVLIHRAWNVFYTAVSRPKVLYWQREKSNGMKQEEYAAFIKKIRPKITSITQENFAVIQARINQAEDYFKEDLPREEALSLKDEISILSLVAFGLKPEKTNFDDVIKSDFKCYIMACIIIGRFSNELCDSEFHIPKLKAIDGIPSYRVDIDRVDNKSLEPKLWSYDNLRCQIEYSLLILKHGIALEADKLKIKNKNNNGDTYNFNDCTLEPGSRVGSAGDNHGNYAGKNIEKSSAEYSEGDNRTSTNEPEKDGVVKKIGLWISIISGIVAILATIISLIIKMVREV